MPRPDPRDCAREGVRQVSRRGIRKGASQGRYVQARYRAACTRWLHLGEGTYVAQAGDGVWLTAENSRGVTDAIYLEPGVAQELVRFLAAMKGQPPKP